MADELGGGVSAEGAPLTSTEAYAERLRRRQSKWWKKILPVQAPYRWNLRRVLIGRTLDVGCGIGRNLANLEHAVGVDHNAASIAIAKKRGHVAFTVEEFQASSYAVADAFDSLLFAHVLEHMPRGEAIELVRRYLPYLRSGGRVCFVTPQERGYASDPTHIEFVDFEGLHEIVRALGLRLERSYSFPFPRWSGSMFIYNEFVVVATLP
ncbi:class I SAM-dependent methyltransferase [Agromyces fucosus]|uniref:Class I SAM-dependent methyltransferase n=1 Tax=Agromyces fucosus TaxID=41985 RepID=A0A4Q2JW35_9MICO|nr:class I SAM-dependent methyltransferase [Agromyces fucosus]RXZ51009.1 class I SAM-dependent methyltransferase [Agromyces fucosus]